MLSVQLFPEPAAWKSLSRRPFSDTPVAPVLVRKVFETVAAKGDDALRHYTLQFDNVSLGELRVSDKELSAAAAQISEELKSAIHTAAQNIRCFHEAQQLTEPVVETMPGVRCWRKSVPVDRVGCYVPGGSAPLFSTVLMLGIPAQIAGCTRRIVCTPPDRSGGVHPAILYAASIAGITDVFKVGGIQAIAAMSCGTATIPAVDKIFGPGNRYVTAAKQYAQQSGIAVDMPAGPSEVLVIADSSAVPAFVAADLLSQAEHGPDSQVMLLTDSGELLVAVQAELRQQLELLPRKDIALQALQGSRGVVLSDIDTCIAFSNVYAPEHLILAVEHPVRMSAGIRNAGSVFLGNYTCESAGDYASGTNHTLPTAGYARAYSGVSLESFTKKISFQSITPSGLELIGPVIETMASAEGLDAHKAAVRIRLSRIQSDKL
ncbi:histidinol dehydrogenase [Rurimicrobium arvi]|uniref:Histidinol dehydrogenase n=1 Tax=Rurimicrobium arvi TaxID=2049916 RepID=A0ABP8N0Y9_9BACT